MKKYIIKVNGTAYEVEVEEVGGGAARQPSAAQAPAQTPIAKPTAVYAPAGVTPDVSVPPMSAPPVASAAPQGAAPAAAAPSGSTSITAPMPGTIIRVVVNVGDTVKRSQPVVLLEAMKMENEIVSPADGKVLAIHTTQGASVNTGDLLVSIG